MAARIQGEFGGWWNSITGRLSRQFFSWSLFRADYKETWGFGVNIMFILISLRTRNCRDLQADQNYKGSVQKTQRRKPYLELTILVTCAVVVQDLATQWIQAYPWENKTSQETQRSLQKFLEPERRPKVIYTDNSLEFGEACEDFSWNYCTSTPHRSETNGIAEWAVRRVKEGTSAVLLQSGLNESWWADSMECYTYLRNVTDLLSDGKTPIWKTFWETIWRTYYSTWFIGWVSSYNFEGPVTNPSILERKFYLDCSSDTLSTRGEFGRVTYWLQTLRSWKTMDASEIYSKRLNAKEVIISPKRRIYFSNRRCTNQNTWRRSGTENIHLDTAATNSRRGSRWLSKRIRRVSSTTSWLISGCRWSDKRFLVHVGKLHIPPSRWTQSQTLLAERRNHSLFHWNTLT